MKEKKIKRRATVKKRFEWAIVKRERKTGKIIKTVSLDPDTEIPDDVKNFSEYVRDLIKQDVENRRRVKATTEKTQPPDETMTDAELELYEWLDNSVYFHKYGYEKYASVHEYLTLQPDGDTLLKLLPRLDIEIERCQREAEEQENSDRVEHFKVPRVLIEAVKKDPQLWNKVYEKFRKHWREEHRQPEIYRKEAMWFEGKSWTGQDVLEKVLPEIDLHAPGSAEKGNGVTIKKIAEIFRVDYQTAYNKIVPRIESVLKAAAVKIV